MKRRFAADSALKRAEDLEKEVAKIADKAAGARSLFQLGLALLAIGGTVAVLASTVLLSPAPLLVESETSSLPEPQNVVDGFTEIADIFAGLALVLLVVGVVCAIIGRFSAGRHESEIARKQLEHSRALAAFASYRRPAAQGRRGLLQKSTHKRRS